MYLVNGKGHVVLCSINKGHSHKETTIMAKGNNSGGSVATLDISETIQNASSQRESLSSNLNAARETVCAQMTELAGQLRQIDDNLESIGATEFSVPDLSEIDYLYAEVEATPVRRRRSTKSSGDSSGTRTRGGGATTLPNCILISMDQSRRGTQFGISEVHVAVQEAPTNYKFSGTEKSAMVNVSSSLGKLVDEGHVERVDRGTYVLTAEGSKAAKASLKEIGS